MARQGKARLARQDKTRQDKTSYQAGEWLRQEQDKQFFLFHLLCELKEICAL
jgi:hypothetical protein